MKQTLHLISGSISGEHEIIIENVLCFHLLDECCHATLKSYFQSKAIGNRLNSCMIFRKICFGTFGENCALLHETEGRKLRKHGGYSPTCDYTRHDMSRNSLGKTNLHCPLCDQPLKIVVIRNAMFLFVNSQFFSFHSDIYRSN